MADTITSFLVSLGFKVDAAQQKRFEDALAKSKQIVYDFGKDLAGILDKFAMLGTVATGTAVSVGAAMLKIGQSMANLGYEAQQLQTSPQAIQAFAFALQQVGGTAEQAHAALANLAQRVQTNPGLLRAAFGIANNTPLPQALMEMGKQFRAAIDSGNQIQLSQMQQRAAAIGIDQRLFYELARTAEMQRAYAGEISRQQGLGLNTEQNVRTGISLTQNFNELRQTLEDISDRVFQTFGPKLDELLKKINTWFRENLPWINEQVDKLGSGFDAVTGAISKFWNSLSPGEQRDIMSVGAIAALYAIVRLPLGIGKIAQILALSSAITYFVTSYTKWKETGQNDDFIDWNKWGPVIDRASKALTAFNDHVMKPLFDMAGVSSSLIAPFEALAAYLVGPAFGKAILRLLVVVATRNPLLAAALATLAGVYWFNAEGQADIKEKAKEMGFEQRGGTIDDPEFYFVNPKTGERMSWEEMMRRQGRDPGAPLLGRDNFIKRWWNGIFGSSGGGGKGGASDEKMAAVRDSLAEDLGISKEAAAGIVSNLNAESDLQGINEKNPLIPGSRGGFGWAQWTGDRRVAFEKWAAEHHLDPSSDEANYGFLVHELQTNYRGVLERLRAGNITAEQAANIVFTGFESGGDPRLEGSRAGHVGMADRIAKLATGQSDASKLLVDMHKKAENSARLGQTPQRVPPSAQPAAPGTGAGDTTNNHINPVTNINVSGVSDPDRAADLANRRAQTAWNSVVRQLQPVII